MLSKIVSQKKKNINLSIDVLSGGKRGIRTLGTLLTHTRVPVVRLRPAQPSFRMFTTFYIISKVQYYVKRIFTKIGEYNKTNLPFVGFTVKY